MVYYAILKNLKKLFKNLKSKNLISSESQKISILITFATSSKTDTTFHVFALSLFKILLMITKTTSKLQLKMQKRNGRVRLNFLKSNFTPINFYNHLF